MVLVDMSVDAGSWIPAIHAWTSSKESQLSQMRGGQHRMCGD